ncbi:MAG: 30S ribosomal protein S27ae [Candidatus Thermoplasmatota archaeon]|jgi:small subunit ribosomal protein S27Ae
MPGEASKFYKLDGNKLTRTHKACPKCGPGVFLAQHKNRSHCGRCGFMEKVERAEKSHK